MPIDYSLPKPTPGTSRATSPTETEILTDISDTVADVGSRLDTLEADTTAGDHIADPTGAHAASAVSIADAGGYYTATDDGNADAFISSDGVHPTIAGHRALGFHLAEHIAAMLRAEAA